MKLSIASAYAFLTVYLLFTLFPIYWLIITSTKTYGELSMIPPTLLVEKPVLDFYYGLFTTRHFAELTRNSLIVGWATSIIATFVGTMLAYGLSKLKLVKTRARNAILFWVLSLVMFPSIVLALPYFFLLTQLRLTNTLVGLSIVYMTFTMPFAIWTMKGFFDEYSTEIEEAAAIDGASRWQVFLRIAVPILLPAMATVVVFNFIFCWQEFLYALLLTNDYTSQTITVGVYGTISGYEPSWEIMAAAGVVASLPVIAVFLILRKYVTRTMSFGVVKG
jgi:multiple sugar transport system permease protein